MKYTNKQNEMTSILDNYILPTVENYISEHADELKSELSQKNKLLPPNILLIREKEKVINTIKEEYSKYTTKIEEGFNSINTHRNLLSLEENDQLNNDFKNIAENLGNLSVPAETKGVMPKDLLKMSDNTLYYMHKIGYVLYEKKLCYEASNIFFVLTFLNPGNKDYWTALGVSEKMNAEYDNAIGAFIMVSILDPSDPKPHLSLVDCYIRVKEKKLAEFELSEAEKLITNSTFDELKTCLNNLLLKINQM